MNKRILFAFIFWGMVFPLYAQTYVQDAWLTDIPYLKKDNRIYIRQNEVGKSNTGENYSHYIYSQLPYSQIIYHLNGQYDRLSAVWTICYAGRDYRDKNNFVIYADNRIVYNSPVITGGDLPVNIDININYCNTLIILFKDGIGAAELGNIKVSSSTRKTKPTNVQQTGTLPVWLTDLNYLTNNNVVIKANDIGTANTGDRYSHYIYSNYTGNIVYYLQKKYNTISGVWVICQAGRNTRTNEMFELYADDILVYRSPAITSGSLPVEFNININYCNLLKIVFISGDGSGELGNIRLEG